MHITGIISSSGGAGASTVTNYVAQLLSSTNKKTLIIDLNPINEVARTLKAMSEKKWAKQLNQQDFTLKSIVDNTKLKHIDIITTYKQTILDSYQFENSLIQTNFFGQIATTFNGVYDHVIIDYSAHYTAIIREAISICDKIIVVINSKPMWLNTMVILLKMIADSRRNMPLTEIKLILNQVDTSNNGSKLVIKQYFKFLPKKIRFSVYINSFVYKYVDGKLKLNIPITSFKHIVKYINDTTTDIENYHFELSQHDETSILGIIENLINQIYNGTAKKHSLQIYSNNNFADNEVLLDYENIALNNSDISRNINNLFEYIRNNKISESIMILDDEGLVIAETGVNGSSETLAAYFSQYVQLLISSQYNKQTNGFWIKIDEKFLCVMAVQVKERVFGIVMQCEKILSSIHTENLYKMLNKIIKKGVSYE